MTTAFHRCRMACSGIISGWRYIGCKTTPAHRSGRRRMPAPTRRWPPARRSPFRAPPPGPGRTTLPGGGGRWTARTRPRSSREACRGTAKLPPSPPRRRPRSCISGWPRYQRCWSWHVQIRAAARQRRAGGAASLTASTGSPSPSKPAKARRNKTHRRRRSRHPPASPTPCWPTPKRLRPRPGGRHRAMSSAGAGCSPPSGRATPTATTR